MKVQFLFHIVYRASVVVKHMVPGSWRSEMRTAQGQLDKGTRFLIAVALNMAIILQLFLAYMVITLSMDLGRQRQDLATKDDIFEMALVLGPYDQADVVMQTTCITCHTWESCTDADKVLEETRKLLHGMIQNSGVQVYPGNIRNIGSTLTFLKCARCHAIDQCKEIEIQSQVERWGLIVRMMKKPDARISLEDARQINDNCEEFWSWYTP